MGSQRVGYDWTTFTSCYFISFMEIKPFPLPPAAAAAAKSLQSCPTLCYPMDCSLPGFSVHGILQARTLEWIAISFSNAWKWKVKSENEVSRSCPTLSDPMDCSLPGFSIHGIFRATVLEWGAIAFSFHCLIEKTKNILRYSREKAI